MLTDKELDHIAALARIKISEKEKEGLKKDLSSILEYIEKLNKADTEGVQPLYQTAGLVNAFRTDEPRGEFKMNESLNEKLIGQAPDKENGFIKVKSVMTKK